MPLETHIPTFLSQYRRARRPVVGVWRLVRSLPWPSRRLCAACIAIALLPLPVAYVTIDLLGRAALAETQARARAEGRPATFEETLPAAVSDADNFAAHPFVIRQLALIDEASQARKEGRESPEEALVFKLEPYSFEAGQYSMTDVEQWERHLGPGVLQAYLDRHAIALAQVEDAARRPFLRDTDCAYRKDPSANCILPQICKSLADWMLIRAAAKVHSGDSVGARNDFAVALKLARLIGQDPALLGSLHQIHIASEVAIVIRRGVRKGSWNDPDLAMIQESLSALELLCAIRNSARLSALDYLRFMEAKDTRMTQRPWIARWMPSGWWLGMGALALEDEARWERISLDLAERRMLEGSSRYPEEFRWCPLSDFTRLQAPFWLKADVLARHLVGPVQLDLAWTALALERWRLAHGRYPGSLAELPTDPSGAIHHDILTGEPFLYRTHEDGTFTLYSVGPNRVDDGGIKTKVGEGDWVW